MKAVDKALDLLGPNAEMLSEILWSLGGKHVRMGVKAEFFPALGMALVHACAEVMGNAFTTDIKKSWIEVYGALSQDMLRGLSMYSESRY
jgi:hemoglobin-like flavoprotein